MESHNLQGLSFSQACVKRGFDILFSCLGIVVAGPVILAASVAAWIDTGKNGFFLQDRVGREGRHFKVIKIRTMRDAKETGTPATNVTTASDPRITRLGRLLRRYKIDELPQLVNVMLGTMSFVGPRPDVVGFVDQLTGEDRLVLTVRPGITGPASLKYKNEEELLATQVDPESYNREVIYPDKVRLNLEYVRNYRLVDDLRYVLRTLIG